MWNIYEIEMNFKFKLLNSNYFDVNLKLLNAEFSKNNSSISAFDNSNIFSQN